MARSPAPKKVRASKKQTNSTTPIVVGSVAVLCFLIFIFLNSQSTSNETTGTESESSNSSLSLKMALETLKEKAELAITKQDNSLNALPPLLEMVSEIRRKQNDFLQEKLVNDYQTLLQKLQQKIDQVAEREFKRIQEEEQRFLQAYDWSQARKLWENYPDSLKASPEWYTKVQETLKHFDQKKEERFLEDVKTLNQYVDDGNKHAATKLKDQLLAYASEEQKEELEPLFTQIRGMLHQPKNLQNKPPVKNGTNSKQHLDPEETENPEDPEETENHPPDESDLSSLKKETQEKEAEALFLEAEKYLTEKQYETARNQFQLLLEDPRYASTKFVQTIESHIRELFHQANIAAAPEQDKFLARLQAFFQGNVQQVKGEKNVFQIEYKFQHESQMKDFETLREDGLLSDWQIRGDGLYGTSSHGLYWKPNLIGDITVELECRPSRIDNIGICIFTNGYHRRYVFYPSLTEKWARWAGGDGAIISTKEERYQSVKLGAKSLGLAQYQQSTTDETKTIYVKVQRKENKKTADLFFWASQKAISPREKPQITAQDIELEQGQMMILGGSGILITSLKITCSFDPGWLRQFR